LRNRVPSQYEPATWADDDIERRCLLGCVVVGGGADGGRVHSALAELVATLRRRDYHRRELDDVVLTLVEALPAPLAAYDRGLQLRALRTLGAAAYG